MPSKNREDIKVNDLVHIVDTDNGWPDITHLVMEINDFSVIICKGLSKIPPFKRLAFDEVIKDGRLVA